MTRETHHATSADGTRLSYGVSGRGPTVVLVSAALSDRTDHRRLERQLSPHVRVVNYDRRGRGGSDPNNAGGVEREVADLAAIINATGGAATVFGSSSGAVLALRAAGELGAAIDRVIAYEPPLILDDSRAPVPADAADRVSELLGQGRRAAAARYFFGDIMGIPRVGVAAMRLMPGWKRSVRMADTITNDLAVMEGLQHGYPMPPRALPGVTQPVLILTGSKSEHFFHAGARTLAAALPDAEAKILPGLHHGSVAMGAKALAEAIAEFTRVGDDHRGATGDSVDGRQS